MKPCGAAVLLSLQILFCFAPCEKVNAATVSVCDEAGLRAALAGGGSVNFACDGTIVLTNTLTISANTILDGSGRNVVISGNGTVRVFQVAPGVTFSMTNLTVSDGFVVGSGAGVFNEGTVTFDRCTFKGHQILGGAVLVTGAAVHSPGRLTARDCTFAQNRAMPSNSLPVIGGAVGAANSFGPPGPAHGVWAFTNCTFYSNSPDAIATSQEGAVHIVNCTFAANSNAVANTKAAFFVVPTIFLRNSLFAPGAGANFVGPVVDGGHNVSSDGSGRFSHPFSLENVDPLLGSLGANGGPTLTMLPLAGSAAVDGGDNAVGPASDQRGVGRPIGLYSDIGAVESGNTAGHGILQINVATNTITEANSNLVVTVSRAGGASGFVTVSYEALPITATAGADFSATQGTLTFNEGERLKSFVLPLKQDSVIEGSETLSVVLVTPTGGAVLGRSTATLTILDDDVGVSFATAGYTSFESAGTATITVLRTGGSSGTVSAEYQTLPGTALSSDFASQSGVLTFAAGQTNATFSVPLLNDARAEPDETVKLRLSNPTGGASLGIADAVLTIWDDDRTNAVLTVCDEASLRQALAQGGTVLVACDGTITLTNPIPISVDSGLDATGHRLWVSGGGSIQYLFSVAANARFSLKNVTVADGSHQTLGMALASGIRNTGTLSLVNCVFSNNVASGLPAFGGAIYNPGTLSVDGCTFVSNRSAYGSAIFSGDAIGPNPGPGGAIFVTNSTFAWNSAILSTVSKQGPAAGYLLNCTVATNEGSGVAKSGQGPFVLKNSIFAGNSTSNVSGITDAGNNISSDASGFSNPTSRTNTDPKLSPLRNHGGPTPTMVLLPGSPALGAGDNSACPPIDQRGVPRPIGSACDAGAVESTAVGGVAPAFYFSRSDYAYLESGSVATLTVLRNGDGLGPASINFATADITARAGEDYRAVSGTLSFAAGEVMKSIEVVLLDDQVAGPAVTFQLALTDPTTGNPLVPPAQATVTILDEDSVRIVSDCSESSLRAAMALDGRVQLACDGVIPLSSTLTVTTTVVLDATGRDVTISGGGAVRLFDVSASGKLTLLNVKLANGRAAGTNGSPGTAGGAGEGGGIHNLGSIIATNCVLWQNFALGGTGGAPIGGNNNAGPGGPARGGAIFNAEEGTILASGCAFIGNRAYGGSLFPTFSLQSVAGGTGAGGAIYDAGGNVQLHQCIVLSNAATAALGQRFGGQGVLDAAQGGAIFSLGGRLSLTGVELTRNSSYAPYFSGANGGGISQLAGSLAVTNCLLSANRVEGGLGPGIGIPSGWPGGPAFGGGISVGSVSGFIDRTTISDNATIGGPGSRTGGMGVGGGVFCGTGGDLFLRNCTLARNKATAAGYYSAGIGGGICVSNGSVYLTHVTVAENAVATEPRLANEVRLGAGLMIDSGILALTNSIVAASHGASNCFGTVIDGGHNISSDASCSFSAPGSLNNVDPVLGPLADYGGPTPTMALLAGSPALDAAGATSCPPLDQRGIARPFGAGCDIGAFESSPPYTILGRVTGYTAPPTGIQVTAGSSSNWVDAAGNFALHGLAAGSHLVAPLSPEAIFVMSNRLVNLGPDFVDVAFHSYRSNAFLVECVSPGVAHLTFAGEAGQPYRVEMSENNSPWAPRSTNTTATSGLFEFFDTNSNLGELRLFRAWKP